MPDFKFKQFTIRHEDSAMKIGTDSVLLGAWAHIKKEKSILDIGTGTGLLAIMMAQRANNSIVIGVENEPYAFKEAVYNANLSKWKSRIQIKLQDINEYKSDFKFDAIISNPPFFSTGIRPIKKERDQARHASTLSHRDLILSVNRLLKITGTFHVVLPHQALDSFTKDAQMSDLHVIRQLEVRPNESKPIHRVLLSLTRTEKLNQIDQLSLHDVGTRSYSKAYVSLTKDFYLYM